MDLKRLLRLGVIALSGLATAWIGDGAGASSVPDKEQEELARGRELFTREWLPNDKRSHAGDGLGPVFNARSCVACHNRGGIGGAGPKGSNATIVSAFVDLSTFGNLRGIPVQDNPNPAVPHKQPDRSKLAEIHPALRTEGSSPLHRFSLDVGF